MPLVTSRKPSRHSSLKYGGMPFFPFFLLPPLFPLRPPPPLRAAAAAAAVASAAHTALASSTRPRITRFGGALTQGQTWPRKIVAKSFGSPALVKMTHFQEV